MSSPDEQPPADQVDQPQLNDFGKITLQFLRYGQQFSNNISTTFTEMGAREWIRLVIIAGAYLLFRSHAMKYLSKRHVEQMEEEDAKEKAAQLSPNDLRGATHPNVEEYMGEGESSGADWGAKARTRQRVLLKQMMEAEEKLRETEEEDKDIAEFLED